jgi:hypothetical protein
MPELDPLSCGGEDHIVLAGDIAAAQHGEVDIPRSARAGVPVPDPVRDAGQAGAAASRRRIAQRQSRAGWGVDLLVVMHLDDLDVPVRPESPRRFLHEASKRLRPRLVFAARRIGTEREAVATAHSSASPSPVVPITAARPRAAAKPA